MHKYLLLGSIVFLCYVYFAPMILQAAELGQLDCLHLLLLCGAQVRMLGIGVGIFFWLENSQDEKLAIL